MERRHMVSVEDGPWVGGVGKEEDEEWITPFLSFVVCRFFESASGEARVAEKIVLSQHPW
jgi:hypothetical protein